MKTMASSPFTSWQIDGGKWKQCQTLFSWAPKSLQILTASLKLKDPCFLKEKLWQTRQHFKKQRHHFAKQGPYSQSYGLSSSQVQIWELEHKEGWVLKNWCLWTVVLEKTLESTLDSKEIQPENPKGNQPWRIFIGQTDAENEAPILWPPEAKSWLIVKDTDAEKDWRQVERGNRGQDGWMALLTQWIWVWANSGW